MKFLPILAEFAITDFKNSLNFYVNMIGFKVEYQRENPNFAFLSYNGSQIMIQELDQHSSAKGLLMGLREYLQHFHLEETACLGTGE